MKIFYDYPNCTTCKRAKNFLKEHSIEFEERNLKDVNLSKKEIKDVLGNRAAKNLFNTSGKTYRDMNLKVTLKNLSFDEAVDLLAKNSSLIKRPVFIDNENKIFLIGFKENEWQILIK